MHLRNVFYLSVLLMLLGATSTALATSVPDSICYQGVLLDGGGTPVTTPVTVDFTIYDSPTFGMGISWWSTTLLVTPDAEGRFTVYLVGAPFMFNDIVFEGPNRYLEVWIQGEANPMSPRIPMTTVPYAFRVGSIDQAMGGYISGPIRVEGGIHGGKDNVLLTGYGFVCGKNNWVQGNEAVIPGGENNKVDADYSNIGGGQDNIVTREHSAIGGGIGNQVSDHFSVVSGGDQNTAAGRGAAIGGGSYNVVRSAFAVICGGGGWNESDSNSIPLAGGGASILGGASNVASNWYSTVCGGYSNTAAGVYSFAAGYRAKALLPGTFIWADQSAAYDFSSEATNEFAARCTGGVRFVTSIDGAGVPDAGVKVAGGGSSWSTISDRNRKENFTPINGQEILEKLAQLEISTWNYKAQDPSIRHMGPMAQDIYAAFGVGEDDRHITTIDADGIALAAIQGLYEQNADLKKQVAELQALLQRLLAEQE